MHFPRAAAARDGQVRIFTVFKEAGIDGGEMMLGHGVR